MLSNKLLKGNRLMMSTASKAASKDPKASMFFNSKVQETLKSLTGLNYEKIFRVSKMGKKTNSPTYAFMTEKEVQKSKVEAREKALKLLQMPPVMSERKDKLKVLDKDPAIIGFDASTYVFTDITYGIHDRDRIIVAREPDGTLRHATWDERDRMNQIFFPTEGRRFKPAFLFEPNNLKEILGPEKYLYVLDFNCVQFEPDHPDFIRTAQIVYDHIDVHGHFDVLYSTRHYGPMVFFYVWERRTDNIIIHYLKKLDLEAACQVVQLYKLIHSDAKIEAIEDLTSEENQIKLIRSYIKGESKKETKLHMNLESTIETMKRNKEASRATQ